MEKILEQINNIKKKVSEFSVHDVDTLEKFRIEFLGTKGALKNVMGLIKDVQIQKKREAGQLLNDLKLWIEQQFENHQLKIGKNNHKTNLLDISLPGEIIPIGTKHPLNIVKKQIISIFKKLGFILEEGPEIEDDWHNFGAMNLPEHHPARDMQDTFYINKSNDINKNILLRTHTSNTQARVLSKQKPPIRVICPGRVYRNETISARSHCFFHQIEGMYIDDNVSFANLKQTLYLFVQEMFGNDVKIRFRPSYFPFTEPSAEMDISCLICKSKGCNVCKHTGWVEILGSGMVHPNVLENFNIDTNIYTGFAFGMGLERITQLKYQVNDLRLYSENDIRFLKQFISE
ncbi:MAG: phenylalanine--tRNA ligase subunit alpha [Sediminibacterium sp.]|nr:phenylalanine--tRNA ligase subunit alpha [Sediminibacterium sp.]